MDTVDLMIRYECGELVFSEQVQLFAELIKSGHVWKLQGSYCIHNFYLLYCLINSTT